MSDVDRRRAHVDWYVADEKGDVYSGIRDGTKLAVLMDIRNTLMSIDSQLKCYRPRRALDTLERIDRRLARRFPLAKGRRSR